MPARAPRDPADATPRPPRKKLDVEAGRAISAAIDAEVGGRPMSADDIGHVDLPDARVEADGTITAAKLPSLPIPDASPEWHEDHDATAGVFVDTDADFAHLADDADEPYNPDDFPPQPTAEQEAADDAPVVTIGDFPAPADIDPATAAAGNAAHAAAEALLDAQLAGSTEREPLRGEQDERVAAWETLARHPFFADCDGGDGDGPRLAAMLAKLEVAWAPVRRRPRTLEDAKDQRDAGGLPSGSRPADALRQNGGPRA